jgi:hypothetical protein
MLYVISRTVAEAVRESRGKGISAVGNVTRIIQ